MVEKEFFNKLLELYEENIKEFKAQNTGLLIEKIHKLTEEAVEKEVNTKELITEKYIREHFENFTINPQITHIDKNYTIRVEISPDISWSYKKK